MGGAVGGAGEGSVGKGGAGERGGDEGADDDSGGESQGGGGRRRWVRPKAKLQAERLLHKSIAKHSTARESAASRLVLSMRCCEAPALPAGGRFSVIEAGASDTHAQHLDQKCVRWRARTGARAARRRGRKGALRPVFSPDVRAYAPTAEGDGDLVDSRSTSYAPVCGKIGNNDT